MASTNEEIMREEFVLLREDLIKKYDELGMRASGRWADGLIVVAKGLTASLIGEPYTEQLVDGRPPSAKMPPVAAILQWILDKSIKPRKGTVSSLAWAIAKKIQKEGTKYFKDGGTDLLSAVITPERIQRIIDRVTQFNVNGFYSDIESTFKELQNA